MGVPGLSHLRGCRAPGPEKSYSVLGEDKAAQSSDVYLGISHWPGAAFTQGVLGSQGQGTLIYGLLQNYRIME